MKIPTVNVVSGSRQGYMCPHCGGAMGRSVGVEMVVVTLEGNPVAMCSTCAAKRALRDGFTPVKGELTADDINWG